jgi:hypothetical protein
MLVTEMENYTQFPDYLLNMPEFEVLQTIQDKWTQKIVDAVESLEDNIFILTSDVDGVKRREGILDITPLDTDTLDERRYRILLQWYDTFPYTEYDLRDRLSRLCPNGDYILNIDLDLQKIEVRLGLSNKKNYAEMLALINELVPLQIIISATIKYNTWSKYASTKWSALASKTWNEIREEI